MFIIIKRETSKQRFKRLRLRQQAGLLLDESEASQLAQTDRANEAEALGEDEISADGTDSAFCNGMGTLLVPANHFDTLGDIDAFDTQSTPITAMAGDEIMFDSHKVAATEVVNAAESTSPVKADGGGDDLVNAAESTSADGGGGVVASCVRRKRKACYVLVDRDPKLQQARLHVRDERTECYDLRICMRLYTSISILF